MGGASPVFEHGMPEHAPGFRPQHLGAGVVVEAFQRHAAEVPEGSLVGGQSDVQPLVGVGLHPEPARVAQGEDEEMRDRGPLADPLAHLAEIDLRLVARGRLEAHALSGDSSTRVSKPPLTLDPEVCRFSSRVLGISTSSLLAPKTYPLCRRHSS
jgi:hypothetical protein